MSALTDQHIIKLQKRRGGDKVCSKGGSRTIVTAARLTVANFPKCSRTDGAGRVIVSAELVSTRHRRVSHTPLSRSLAYLSNQFPTTLADLSPPTWMLSLRHLSWPLKMEWLVQRTSPSLVRRTLPVEAHSQAVALVSQGSARAGGIK